VGEFKKLSNTNICVFTMIFSISQQDGARCFTNGFWRVTPIKSMVEVNHTNHPDKKKQKLSPAKAL